MLSYTVLFVFALFVCAMGKESQTTSDDDKCLQSAFELYLRNMSGNVDLSEYVQNYHSRFFYETIWTKPITEDQWRRFCRDFDRGYRSFDACPKSPTKAAWLVPMGLVHYVCKSRLEDFASNAACLKKAIPEANAACAKPCAEFEAGSRTYVHPTANETSLDMLPFLALDCKYLKCTADCHRPIIDKNCPKVAYLQLDSLYVMERALKNMHEPPELREQLKQARAHGIEYFPAPCNLLAEAAANSTSI